jgi:hypothetical protein
VVLQAAVGGVEVKTGEKMKYRGWAPLAGLLLLTGCATNSMKGTPFYTGEYEQREGPASDRVNLWPLLYYRDPALSVLWPIMESCPDHFALRPVYSVYGRGSETPVYNVVWPIARFDTEKGDNRIFPVYWGDDYFHVIPLYWHQGQPLSGQGFNSLFPLWIYYNSGSGTSTYLCWPLYARFDHAEHQGWRLWPIYGTNDRIDRENRWWLASLGYSNRGGDTRGHGFIPFYAYHSNATHSVIYSLPYSRDIASDPGGKSWDLALPLWYREWEGATNTWGAIPLLSWGSNTEEMKDHWYALGLVRNAASEEMRAHHVLPIYYSERSNEGQRFYSLPWWSQDHADGSGWNASFPFYYGGYSTNSSVVVTPLYARKQLADGAEAWSCYIPFVYLDRTKDAHFMTLLGGAWRDGDASVWIALPLLSGGRSGADGGRTVWVGGLAGRQWNPEGHSHYVFPLYAYAPQEKRFSSIVYATWPDGEAQHSMIPLLLSGQKIEDDAVLKYGLLGMVMWDRHGEELQRSRIIPFYAWKRSVYFYTALYGRNAYLKYYFTPAAGSYEGDNSGSWIFPFYHHRVDSSGDVDGRYLVLGSYSKSAESRRHGFFGVYRFREWSYSGSDKGGDEYIRANTHWNYLLLGRHFDNRFYEKNAEGEAGELKRRRKTKSFYPLYSDREMEDIEAGKSERDTALLLALYDTRREKQEDHDYLRRRILWRLWHYEKLNGDASTDIFPGITLDSYTNGYRKYSVLWRLFRYEKDPESGRKELDLLFIPLKR